jgi:hypothetical protein
MVDNTFLKKDFIFIFLEFVKLSYFKEFVRLSFYI